MITVFESELNSDSIRDQPGYINLVSGQEIATI